MRLYLIAALGLLVGVGLTDNLGSQPNENPKTDQLEGNYCATDLLHRQALATDPAYAKRHVRLEDAAYRAAADRSEKALPPPYVLPIVFHIIHENGPEELDDAAVQQSVDYLNQAFANVAYYDQNTGTNTQIQFCLARRTPENIASSGITRQVSNLTDVDSPEDDIPLKDLVRWDPTQYINIWVVREICGLGSGCGVAGYAYFPSAHGGATGRPR